MAVFEELVGRQMKIMDKLLALQSDIERCQEFEKTLTALGEMEELEALQKEIACKKRELDEIQELFQKQTKQVIMTFQKLEEPSSL
ncbi:MULTISPECIES: YgaB family protein [Bacillus]|uniref:YgaB-like protein n=2 Tax=Bacillus TaxID=1386 RepID=A0A0M3R8W9_9BACI|nr:MULTISPECIES: YgaB family protein [Bacillus]ALC80406.1 hypothetical protein AM592_01415 [Bacillus gobiensis]MBP1083739.1 hypothetical protein [Bacillus capparidis]MED1098224.1 YgaB family protein [Bacillus capparidis]